MNQSSVRIIALELVHVIKASVIAIEDLLERIAHKFGATHVAKGNASMENVFVLMEELDIIANMSLA